jgi:hypothetical protein
VFLTEGELQDGIVGDQCRTLDGEVPREENGDKMIEVSILKIADRAEAGGIASWALASVV